MAVVRESPKCAKCGQEIDAIYADRPGFVGDTFQQWDFDGHQCRNIKYFIEHNETRLWVYFEPDYSKPRFISTFNGSRLRMPGYEDKVLWTNDPQKAHHYNTEKDAKEAIRSYQCRTPDEFLEVTEHEFI